MTDPRPNVVARDATAGVAGPCAGGASPMMRAWAAILAMLIALILGTPAAAQTFPKFTGLVVDAAGVLPPDREAALARKLEAFQQRSTAAGIGRQLVVATVPTLGGDEIQDYGYKLGRAWGVGLKGADNGTILLVAPVERKVGIVTGAGVSPVLTDAYTGLVIRSKILPAFKQGDLAGGIEAGTDALIEILSTPDDQAKARAQAAIAAWDKAHRRQGGGSGGVPIGLIFWGVVILFVVVLPMLSRRGRRYGGGGGGLGPIMLWSALDALSASRGGGGWGGGSSSDGGGGGWGGGGFTGGGGGSFDGGGSSGSW